METAKTPNYEDALTDQMLHQRLLLSFSNIMMTATYIAFIRAMQLSTMTETLKYANIVH